MKTYLLSLMSVVLLFSCSKKTDSKTEIKNEPSPVNLQTKKEPLKTNIFLFATVGEDRLDETRNLAILTNYLNTHISDKSISFEPYVVEDVDTLKAELKSGKIHFYLDSPFTIYKVSNEIPLSVIARRWKKGVAEYHSLIFSLKDSGINSLEDLKGKKVGFENEFSTSSHLLPKSYILQQGLTIIHANRVNVKTTADVIGSVFTGDDENTVLWVQRKLISAGAMNNLAYDKLISDKSNFQIIAKTKDVPRHLIAVTDQVDKKIIKEMQKILFSMENSSEGKDVLLKFEKTKRFDLLKDEAEVRAKILAQLKILEK
ncbi:MAG: phosphate/phosphite/phosphonate ABC transporter substrate-binding protein [Lentisphaeria bacterium]|nr:phosphate/phosphite/phosphonate ABC transporter substrate-binding protein [Lentisphaeria bacterium]